MLEFSIYQAIRCQDENAGKLTMHKNAKCRKRAYRCWTRARKINPAARAARLLQHSLPISAKQRRQNGVRPNLCIEYCSHVVPREKPEKSLNNYGCAKQLFSCRGSEGEIQSSAASKLAIQRTWRLRHKSPDSWRYSCLMTEAPWHQLRCLDWQLSVAAYFCSGCHIHSRLHRYQSWSSQFRLFGRWKEKKFVQ